MQTRIIPESNQSTLLDGHPDKLPTSTTLILEVLRLTGSRLRERVRRKIQRCGCTLKPEFVKRSYIYRLGDLILINPVARALNGLGVGLPEVIAVRSVDPEVIGKRLLEALDKSFDDLPDQDLDTRASLKKILSITKIRSWRTFHNNAKLVVAEFGDSAFKDSNSVTVHSIISNGVEAGGG